MASPYPQGTAESRQDIRAVGLLSGGLDSMLAVRIILEQGVTVTALHFRTGFSYEERNRLAGRTLIAGLTEAERAAAQLGVPLEVIDISDEYLSVVLNPRYGYGSGMNPCLDCRILLLRTARAWMEEHNYHFVFTGEVVGQRPKSQMRSMLRLVERESGLQGYLLRPLSAKLLEPTIPELRGWVDRERLYAIHGRSRKEQMALASRFGLQDYPQPYGGCCYLIDQNYARRMRDFLAHEGTEALDQAHAQLLAIGRHFRLPSGQRVIVGRHERENEYLRACSIAGIRMTTVGCPGPLALLPARPCREDVLLAARITAAYSDCGTDVAVQVAVFPVAGADVAEEILMVPPLPRTEIDQLRV